jgi:DNA-binding response OmpR family regulator
MEKIIDHATSSGRGYRAAAASIPPPRILVAEDDAELRDLVATKLRMDGHEVIEVADGGRLLVRLASAYIAGRSYDAFDLIVSDVRMPVCSGLQIVEGLRRAHWPTPVILMTAFGDDATRARAERLGALLFDKPFDVDDLRATVRHIVRAAPARRPTPLRREDEARPARRTLTLLTSCTDIASAIVVKRRLEAAGILGRVAGSSGDVSIYVVDADADAARELLGRGHSSS